MRNDQIKIAVLGLGYVGLPLAVEFSKVTHVVGFDIDDERIQSLKSGVDKTKETTSEELLLAKNLIFTSNFQDLDDANVFIVTVPTPIDQHMTRLAPTFVGYKNREQITKKGDIVIFESTVYPGATEEDCASARSWFRSGV